MTAENETKVRSIPGPIQDNELGPFAGEVVVPEGRPYYVGGTISRRSPKGGVRLGYPLDLGENGSGWNNNST